MGVGISIRLQTGRVFLRRQLLILPENRRDAKRFLLLNQTGQVMAKELANHFVDHRRVGLADYGIAKFPLDG
jgi:hypothetical protein